MIILNKNKDRDFLILNFTDIHLRNGAWTEDLPQKIIPLYVIKTLVEEVKPDLITFTGDIAGSNQLVAYEGFGEYVESFGIPWTVVWGNHDNSGGQDSVKDVEKLFSKYEHFLYEIGDTTLGRGNFVIGINECGRPLEALILMDSHGKIKYTDEEGVVRTIYEKLLPEQIVWYREQVAMLKEKGYKESCLILHIPIFAYKEAFRSALLKGLDPAEIRFGESPDPVFWNKGYEGSYGIMHGQIRTHPYEDGMFDAILAEDFTKTILCGHDHKNNFVINHKGVRFAYATRTGQSSFLTKNNVGGTVIKITSEGVEDVVQKMVPILHLKDTYVPKD